MNLILKVTLCFIILLNINDLRAQTDFRPGYIITNGNDTLNGLIDYRGDVRNANRCDFKETEISVVKEFKPFDIKGYRFKDSKYYVSKSINSNGDDAKVFLEFLVHGIANLYYYPEGHNPQYFIEKTNGQLIELTNEQVRGVVDGKEYLQDSKKYVGILKYTFADCPQIFPLIDQTKLDNKSLIEVTKKYHEYVCNNIQCVIYEKKIPAIRVNFGAYVSMNSSALKLRNNNNTQYDDIRFKAYWPSIGFLLSSHLSNFNEKLSAQVSFELGKINFYGTGRSPFSNNLIEKVQFHLVTATANAGIKYTYPKGKIRPTIMLSGSYSYYVSNEGKRVLSSVSDVYVTEYNERMNNNNMIGYSLKSGLDYHISASVIPFLTIGYANYLGKDKFGVINMDIETINLNAGIYF